MELDELKAAWRKEMEISVSTPDMSWDTIKRNVSEVHRGVRVRDFLFVLVLLFWAVASVAFNRQPGWLSGLSIALVLGTAVFLTYVLVRARLVPKSDDWTLSSRLAAEIEGLENQARIVRGFGSWYLLPMFAAVIVSALAGFHGRTGSYTPGFKLWVYFALCCIWFGGTIWIHRREARTKIQPLLERLKGIQRELME
jgi:hypothetical protein